MPDAKRAATADIARVRQRIAGYLSGHPRLAITVDLIQRVIREQGAERLGLSAAGTAFWFVIAVFPALIATLMVLGLVLDPQQLSATISELEKATPDSLNGAFLTQVLAATQTQPSTLSVAFVVALVVALWSTSTGYYNFARAARLAYGLPPQAYLVARARAFVGAAAGMLLTAGAVIVAAVTLAYAGSQSGVWGILVSTVVAVAVIAVLSGVLAGLFRFSTGLRPPRPRYLPGAALGAVGTVGVFIGFGIYLDYAGNYKAIYGALAGAIILMLGVYFAAYIVLIGAVMNAQMSTRD
ncbi:MAG: YihY/virulence factor BrkB family protein [Candidatus Nanopelagicales bacterium]